jgi:hypothetical protein
MRLVAAALLVAACGCKKQKAADAPPPPADARIADAAPVEEDDAGPAGSLTIHVDWKDAPAEVRASKGRTPCDDPRPPFARVHTLHGVADAVVWIDAPAAAATAPPPALVTLRRCAFDPQVQLARDVLRVRLLDDKAAIADVAWSDALADAKAKPTTIAHLALPVVGHTVEVPLGGGPTPTDHPWLLTVTSDATKDPAYVVVAPHAWVAVTDETGAASFADVPPGEHRVHAWLRPLAGQSARVAEGTITVTTTAAADLHLSIAPP